jgi:hypothetical protein
MTVIARKGSKDWTKRGKSFNGPGSVTVAASMMPKTLAEVEAIAKAENSSRSWAIGRLVVEALIVRSK